MTEEKKVTGKMKAKKEIGCFLMLVSFVLVSFVGCAGIGPGTVTRDRSDYIAAISDSWKYQMLFNMVKIRYGDAPVFLDVSSVISQYQLAGQVNLGATINSDPFSTSQTLGTMGQYVDRPTVTYTPILGDKFARSLMSPVPPAAILSLMQSGYQVDLVFRLLVQEVIVDLAADIEVPDIHVEEKRVNPVYVEQTIEGQNILPLIRIRCSLTKPGDAFVVVPYRNSYFWIDDRDLMSKKMFSFLMFVLTLVETGEKSSTPIVTIPAG